jgi:hypothetical protein
VRLHRRPASVRAQKVILYGALDVPSTFHRLSSDARRRAECAGKNPTPRLCRARRRAWVVTRLGRRGILLLRIRSLISAVLCIDRVRRRQVREVVWRTVHRIAGRILVPRELICVWVVAWPWCGRGRRWEGRPLRLGDAEERKRELRIRRHASEERVSEVEGLSPARVSCVEVPYAPHRAGADHRPAEEEDAEPKGERADDERRREERRSECQRCEC